MTRTPTIVLLGGSGLAPWAWERVAEHLEGGGLRTRAPQLAATGDDRTPAAEVSMQDWIDDVIDELRAQHTDRSVLVAHSFAGYVAAAVLERAPMLVRTAIFLDAAIPSPRRSWFETMGPETEAFMRSLADNGAIPFFTREQLDQVFPGHGISDEAWAWMSAKITPQPLHTYTQPATMRDIDTEATTLAYVRCLRTSPPVAEIDETTPGWVYRSLPTGHWPMITDPLATANMIGELATL